MSRSSKKGPFVEERKPASLSFEEAAALPLVGLTAHQALETMGVRGGETLFVGGGSGGVGHVAVQLAVARGARVIATASERNQDFLRELGAEPLDYAAGDVPARVREITGDGGADAALDLFGGDGREEAFAALRRGGRLVSVAQPPPGAARRLRGPLRLRAPRRRRAARARRAGARAASCARTSRRSSRSSAPPRRTSASRAATCAASSCSASRLEHAASRSTPSSASVAPSVSTKKPTAGAPRPGRRCGRSARSR